MNYTNKRSFSLLVASMMASSAFTAVVSAAKNPYKELAQAEVFFHQVSKVGNKYVVSTESSDTISVNDLGVGEARMFVGEVRSDDIVSQARGEGDASVEAVAKLIAAGKALLPRLETAANAATAELDVAEILTDTTNWIAEVNGKYAGTADGVALIGTMRSVLVALSKVNTTAGAKVTASPFAAALAEGFKAADVPAGEEGQADTMAMLGRSLCQETNNAVSVNIVTGICVSDIIPGIGDGDRKAYKVLCSGQFRSSATDLDDGAGIAALKLAGCTIMDRAELNKTVPVDGTTRPQVKSNSGGGAGAHNVNAANTFVAGRRGLNNNAITTAAGTDIPGLTLNKTKAEQLKDYSGWVENYACYRAKNFLEATEPQVKDKNTVKGVSATYLGATSTSAGLKVTSNTKKGRDAVGITQIKDQSVFVGGVNGTAVEPVILVFTGNTVNKDTTFSGEISLTVDNGKPKKVEFTGNTVKQAEVTPEFIDSLTNVVLPQGFKLTKDMVKEIKTEYKGSQVELTVALTGGDTAKFVFSNGGNITEMPLSVESDSDNEAVKKLFENSNNSVSAMKVSLAGTGKYTIIVPASMAGSWVADLKDGAKVNCYLANGERLDKAAEKSEKVTAAKTSADEDEAKAVNTNVLTAKKNGDNLEITVDSSKVEVGDNDMLLFTKEELDLDDAKAEAEEEEEDADADVDDENVEDEEEAATPATPAATEPEITTDEVTTGNEEAGETAMVGEGSETALVGEANAENAVPATGAAASAAALAVAALAAGAVALKKNRE